MGEAMNAPELAQILVNIQAQIQTLGKRLTRIQQQEETGFGDAPGADYVEPKPPDYSRKQANKGSGYRFNSLIFSGTSKDPNVYLCWESTMETWLQSNNIPKEKKLSQAVQGFTKGAYEWWLKENIPTVHKKPVLDWRDLKARMHKEFVEKYQAIEKKNVLSQRAFCKSTEKPKTIVQAKGQLSPSLDDLVSKSFNTSMMHLSLSKRAESGLREPTSKGEETPAISLAMVQKSSSKDEPLKREVAPKATTTSSKAITKSPDPPTQGKSSNLVNSKEPTCYKCHKRGHFAANCSIKKMFAETSLVENTKQSIDSDSLSHSEFLVSNARLMHLSLPKSFDPGIRQEERVTRKEERLQGEQILQLTCPMEDEKVEEEPPDAVPSPARLDEKHELTTLDSYQLGAQDSKQNSENPGKSLVISRLEENNNYGAQGNKEKLMLQLANTITVSLNISKPISIILNSDMMHLLLSLRSFSDIYHVQNAEKENSFKEKPPDQTLFHFTDLGSKNTKSVPQVSPSITKIISEDSKVMNLLEIRKSENSIPCLKLQQKRLGLTSFKFCKKPIMHLFLVQRFEIVSGTKDIKHKDPPQEENLLLNQSKHASPLKVDKTKAIKATIQRSHEPGQNTGVIISFLLKGEPPDVPHFTRTKMHQGKTLNSQKLMNTNLLFLGAGDIVSRTKPFQEGEYDTNLESSSAKEHGSRSHEVENMKMRRAKEACQWSSAQTEVDIKHSNSTNIWRAYSTHPEFTRKKNHTKRSPYEEDIEDTSWQMFNGPDGDMRLLIKSFRPNHNESSNETGCSGNLTHQRTEANWIHAKMNYGLKVIQLLNRRMLCLPYLEAGEFNHLQTKLWRPGDTSKHSGDTSNSPGESANIFQCTSTHMIRRIMSYFYLPYMEAFTPCSITHQRLVFFMIRVKQDLGRLFIIKISRYKSRNPLHSALLTISH